MSFGIIIDRNKNRGKMFVGDIATSQHQKIGKEINRYKKLDGINKTEIERRLGVDAQKLNEKKYDSTLDKQIARDTCRGLSNG